MEDGLLNFKAPRGLIEELRKESFRGNVSVSEMLRACVLMALPFLKDNPNVVKILNGKIPDGCIHSIHHDQVNKK